MTSITSSFNSLVQSILSLFQGILNTIFSVFQSFFAVITTTLSSVLDLTRGLFAFLLSTFLLLLRSSSIPLR